MNGLSSGGPGAATDRSNAAIEEPCAASPWNRSAVDTGRYGAALLFCLVALLLPFAPVNGQTLWIVRSDPSPLYAAVETGLKAGIRERCPDATACGGINLVTLDAEALETGPGADVRPDLVVSIGTRAARALSAAPPAAPVLYTLVPDGTAGERPWGAPRPQDGAIYLDQPLDRQLRLALQVKPEAARVGVLLGPAQRDLERKLRAAGASLGLSVIVGLVEDESEVGPAIESVLQSSDLLLALPNPGIFNRRTLFNILLSSYHSRVPVIGFSAAYVKSGALAAVFTPPGDLGREAAETVVDHLLSAREGLPPARYPDRFTVAINPQVARSLDIKLPDAEELERLLREAER